MPASLSLSMSPAQKYELSRAHSDNDDVHRLRGMQENILAALVGVPASVFSLDPDPVFVPTACRPHWPSLRIAYAPPGHC